MALTNEQLGEMYLALYMPGQGKEELKALPALPSTNQIKQAFSNLDDTWEANQSAFKSAIDLGIGFSTSAALAKKIFKVWLLKKVGLI